MQHNRVKFLPAELSSTTGLPENSKEGNKWAIDGIDKYRWVL
jgi:hypothetical protein